MTTIAVRRYKDRVIVAADSQSTWESEGGTRKHRCTKIYEKTVKGQKVILATAGETSPGLLFVKWYGSKKAPPFALIDGDASFDVLIVVGKEMYVADKYCIPEPIVEEFFALGSGSAAALGAMHMGADPKRAVEIASKVDPYTSGVVKVSKL